MGISSRFSGRRFVVAFWLILVTLFFLWWNPRWLFDPLSNVLGTLFRPVAGILSWSAYEIHEVVHFVDSLSTLKQEHASLTTENIRLKTEVANLEFLRRENQTLRELVHFDEGSEKQFVYAEVIGREGSGVATTILINRGTASSMEEGLPVLGEGGVLVGKVIRVSPGTSEVRLLPHPETVVSAALSTTAEQGIIRGDHGLGMIFDLALQRENLRPGEAVVSTGLGDSIPAGILIGTIESVRPSVDRLFQQAIVVSPLRFDTLRAVMVLKP